MSTLPWLNWMLTRVSGIKPIYRWMTASIHRDTAGTMSAKARQRSQYDHVRNVCDVPNRAQDARQYRLESNAHEPHHRHIDLSNELTKAHFDRCPVSGLVVPMSARCSVTAQYSCLQRLVCEHL